MNAEIYPLSRDLELPIYNFLSSGSKGVVKKGIMFQMIDSEQNLFNLAFGDWDDHETELDDTVVTNNADTQIVLNTVASAVLHFMQENPDCKLIATGSTASRNRLYQINILRHWEEISVNYNVEGFLAGAWQPFMKGINYDGFLLTCK